MAGSGRLEGMTDAQIEGIDKLAIRYQKAQKKRMAALAEEVKIKDEIMTLMKDNKKKKYVYEDVEIEIVATKEKIKVKIKNDDDEEEAA